MSNMMRGTYAFSFDRETFEGTFETRDQAYRAAVQRATQLNIASDTPIYTGQRMAADPQASGHAREVCNSMRRRSREHLGDVADGYLKHVSDDQLLDLDRALEAVIGRWLGNYKLAPTWFRIGAISEHAMPLVHQVPSPTDREVQVGMSE